MYKGGLKYNGGMSRTVYCGVMQHARTQHCQVRLGMSSSQMNSVDGTSGRLTLVSTKAVQYKLQEAVHPET